MAALRYIDKDGREASVDGVKPLLEAVEAGRLGPETMVFDEQASRWIKAADCAEYRSLAAGRAMASVRDEQKLFRKQRAIGWALLVGGVVVLVLSDLAGPGAVRGAFLAGQFIVWALIVSLVAFGISARLSVQQKGAVWLVACAGLCLWAGYQAVQVVVDEKNNQESRAAAREAAARLADLTKESATMLRDTADGKPSAQLKSLDAPAPPASQRHSNQYATIKDALEMVERHARAMAKNQQEFDAALTKVRMDLVLAPEALTTKSGIDRSRRILRDARKLITTYEKKAWAMMDSLLKDAEALSLSPSEKRQFLAGMAKTRPKSVQLLKDWFAVQHQGLDEFGATVDFMGTRVGETRLENNLILFPDSGDADIYNKHIETINKLVKLEEDMMRRQAATMENTTATLRKLAQ